MQIKKLIAVLMVFSMLIPAVVFADPITTPGVITAGAWVLNFFSSRAQNWISPIGVVDIEITIPPSDQPYMEGIKTIHPLWLGQEEGSSSRMVNLIRGWGSEVSAFFPTGPKDARELWYRFDSGKKQRFPATPLRLKLPEPPDNKVHSLEMGVSLGGNSWGSLMILYRYRTLADYYAEMLANQERFGQLMRDKYQDAKPAQSDTPRYTYGWVEFSLLDQGYNPLPGAVEIKVKTPSGQELHGRFNILPDGRKMVLSAAGKMDTLFCLERPFVGKLSQLEVGSELWFKPEGCPNWLDYRKIEQPGEAEMVLLRKGGK